MTVVARDHVALYGRGELGTPYKGRVIGKPHTTHAPLASVTGPNGKGGVGNQLTEACGTCREVISEGPKVRKAIVDVSIEA